MKYAADVIPVCPNCAAEAENEKTKQCAKCGIAYCEHYSSNIDIRFCGNCMSDFKVSTSTEIRTEERSNEAGEVVYKKRVTCKRLHLEGSDWLFSAAKIHTLSDDDLDATIEYHSAIKGMMLQEREERRVEKWQQLNKLNMKLMTRADVDSTGAIIGSLLTDKQKAEREEFKKGKKKVTTTTTKKVDGDAIMAAIASLLKQGITKEKIAEMFKVTL